VNAQGTFDWTPLMVASLRGHVQVAKELLEHGADIEAKDDEGDTPLHNFAWKGHLAFVIELLGYGADIDSKNNVGSTPLHFAAMEGRLAIVIELLGHGAEIRSNESNGTTTILGKRKSRGANINVKNNIGNTPLHFAGVHGSLPVVKALLNGGADISAANNLGELPVHQAVSWRKSAVAKYLLQMSYATTCRLPLHELVEDLTWIGNPNISDVPPLRIALHEHVLDTNDVVEIVEFLAGRNPAVLSSRNQDGSLPLHVACRCGASFSIVQSLVDLYEASAESLTPQGDLPLFLACEMSETPLDTIFILMKLYPDLVYR
jgi:ankyrin repeat protein